MKLTAAGRAGLGVLLLTVLSSASTGNNLLYLLLGLQASAFLLSWLAGRWNLARVRAEFEFPGQIFRGSEFPLSATLRNAGQVRSLALVLRWGPAEGAVEVLAAGESRTAVLRVRLPHRGINRLEGLALESAFPFGLIRHRRTLQNAEGLAYPALREIRAPGEISSDLDVSGRAVMRRGRGDELYGVREKDPMDDAKLINWKLSAKAGRPMVNEYAGAEGSKITVRLEGARGPAAEARIAEAASAVRYYVDAGAEVRLLTPESQTDYGKGLLHLDRCLEDLARLGEGKEPRPAPAPEAPPGPVRDSPTLRRLLYLGTMIVSGSLFLVDEINPKLALALLAAVPAGWAWHELKLRRIPEQVWDALSLACLAYLLLYDWRASGVAVANTHLIAYLLANRALADVKAWELRQSYLIIFLGFFLVSALTISPWYFAFFLVFAAFSALWLMIDAGLSWPGRRRWSPALAGLGAGALALTSALFMATPRVDRFRRLNPFVAMGIDKLQAQNQSVTGYTDDISLGFYGNLKRSTAKVMRVSPVPAPKERPPGVRLRGAAYDRFDGRRWTRPRRDFRYRFGDRYYWSAGGRGWAPRAGQRMVFPGSPTSQAHDVMIYPMNQNAVFTVGTPAVLEGTDAAYFDVNDSVFVTVPYMGGARYRVTAAQEAGYGRWIEGYDELVRERYLQLPDDSPRRRRLAGEIAPEGLDPARRAAAIEAYLRDNYSYSTFQSLKDKSIDDFLFSDKTGNCEYFATAAAVLLREVGIPSRLATGFLADDWNEYGRFYDVRQSQAHAWTEAYLPGRGWITLEPTPPQGFFGSSGLQSKLRQMWEAMEGRWYRHVIGYDQYVQRNTFHRLGKALSKEVLFKFLWAAGALATAVGLAFALAALRPYLRRRKAEGFFAEAERACLARGVRREPHWTAREFAREAAGRRPELAPVRELAELHYLESYRGRPLSAEERAEVRRLLGRLKEPA